jgi:hypothetical protein
MERGSVRRTRRTISKIDQVLSEENQENEATEAPVTSIRPPLREEDPRELARLRTMQLLEHLGEDGIEGSVDEFYIDPSVIPDGWDYEWKRKSIQNWEDVSHQLAVAHTGWTPVPISRHPSMMPEHSKYQFIERKGCILMERPLEITKRFKAAAAKKATQQVLQKEAQLSETPMGTMDRSRPNINRNYNIPIPEK